MRKISYASRDSERFRQHRGTGPQSFPVAITTTTATNRVLDKASSGRTSHPSPSTIKPSVDGSRSDLLVAASRQDEQAQAEPGVRQADLQATSRQTTPARAQRRRSARRQLDVVGPVQACEPG